MMSGLTQEELGALEHFASRSFGCGDQGLCHALYISFTTSFPSLLLQCDLQYLKPF